MLTQIEMTNEMDWQAILVADTYNSIIEAANSYNFTADCQAAYVNRRLELELGDALALLDSYIQEAETIADEMDSQPFDIQEEYIDWLASVQTGIPMS